MNARFSGGVIRSKRVRGCHFTLFENFPRLLYFFPLTPSSTMNNVFVMAPEIGRHLGSIFEGFVFIYICSELFKTKSPFNTGYFLILNVGYGVDFINNVFWFTTIFWGYSAPVLLVQWYMRFFMGFWSFILGINRCTALAYPTVYGKIWSPKLVYCISILVLIFPFIANGYSLSDMNCRLRTLSPGCNDYRISYHQLAGILNTIFAIGSLLAIGFGVWKAPKSINRSLTFKLEFRLITQTIIVSVFSALYFLTYVYATNIYEADHEYYDFLTKIGNYFYFLSHYPPIIALFFISQMFRNGFLHFYRIKKTVPKQANPLFISKVVTITK